jgi:hypothetical protein
LPSVGLVTIAAPVPASGDPVAAPVFATTPKHQVAFASKTLFDKKSEILIKNSLTYIVIMRTLRIKRSPHFTQGGGL